MVQCFITRLLECREVRQSVTVTFHSISSVSSQFFSSIYNNKVTSTISDFFISLQFSYGYLNMKCICLCIFIR